MTGPHLDVESIFTAARAKQNAREQAAYLERACAGDKPLRKRVEALLTADRAARSFLRLTPDDGTSSTSETSWS